MSSTGREHPTTYEGALTGGDLRIAVVCGRFNDFITERLLAGCRNALERHGVAPGAIDVAWTPGAFEIPLVARTMAETGRYDAVVALGAVIRGATSHYEEVAGGAATGVARAAMDTGVPVIFGVLTTENIEQAVERAGTKAGNKGAEAGVAAIEMANLLRDVKGE